jgi:hypothetical protein
MIEAFYMLHTVLLEPQPKFKVNISFHHSKIEILHSSLIYEMPFQSRLCSFKNDSTYIVIVQGEENGKYFYFPTVHKYNW